MAKKKMSKEQKKRMDKEKKERFELIYALKKVIELGKAIDVKKIEKLLVQLRAEEALEKLREDYP